MSAKTLSQGTQEWLNWRRNHITSTDASSILGINPWKSAYKLWEEKVGLKQPDGVNSRMQRGTDLEPVARSLAEDMLGMKFNPIVMEHREHVWMGASLDGISEDGKIALEIKCPKKEVHEIALNGNVPSYYVPQVSHILEVSEAEKLIYFSFDGEQGVIVDVFRDESYNKKMIELEREFLRCVQTFCPPSFHLDDYVQIENPIWEESGRRCLAIDSQINQLQKEKDALRAQMLSMCGQSNATGGGITMLKTVQKGRIDYDTVLRHYEIDTNLDVFRKPPIESWRIKSA